MNADWTAWVAHNLKRGCNRFDMLREITKDGQVEICVAEAALGLPSMPRPPHALSLINENIRLFVLRRFLEPAQCRALCGVIQEKRSPSEVCQGGAPGDRTSTTCHMRLHQHTIVDEVDALICKHMGFVHHECEVLQGQHYKIGQQFRKHCDYLPETETSVPLQGNRTWTFMVYLTPVDKGGETEFTKLGLTFSPSPGTALVWCNYDAQGRPNPWTEHRAHPVRAGTKMILTKWFREKAEPPDA